MALTLPAHPKWLTLPAHPKWVSLGKTNLSATGLVVKEGTTALVLGTDFEINYALGLLRATKAGAVADTVVR